MRTKIIHVLCVYLFCVVSATVSASSELWLETGKYRRDVREPTKITLNLGSFPNERLKSSDGKIWIIIPDGSLVKPTLKTSKGRMFANVKTPFGGLYTVVASCNVEHGVQKKQHYASLQFYRFGREAKIIKPTVMPSVPLQIKPITQIHMHRRLFEGDSFVVQVFYKGLPLAMDVSVSTQEGWSKTVRTDKHGVAKLDFIKDRFYDNVNKIPEKYMFRVEHTDGLVTYTATYMLDIYPTPWNWQSKSMGYFTALAALIVVAVMTAMRRRRK